MRRVVFLVFCVATVGCALPMLGQTQHRPVVIYVHGRIIEDQGPSAVSPDFGPYRFYAIVDSLRASGYDVIAEQRPPNTDGNRFALHVALQVDSILAAGVPPSRVAVVGFSKGGGIAIRASARLGRGDITFVWMGACSPGGAPDLQPAGRILSIFEASDEIGQSCATLLQRASSGSVTAERKIDTGRRHGAFFTPRAEWLTLVRQWIDRRPLSP